MNTKRVKIIVSDPVSGKPKVIESEITEVTLAKLEALLATQDVVPKDKVLKAIYNLELPAEAKAVLAKIADITVTIGNAVFAIGKRLLELTLYFIREYPNAATGVIVGAVIGLAFNFIPLLGQFFSSILTPLFAALGLAIGFWRDMQDKALKNRIESEIRKQLRVFEEIKTIGGNDG